MSEILPYCDEELFRQISHDRRKGFESLYKQEFVSIFYFVKRFVAEQQAAEDITTETFLKLWERIEDFINMTGVRAFLYRVAKNSSLNYLRDHHCHIAHHEQLLYLIEKEDEDALAEQQLTSDIYRFIYEEIEKLPPQLKTVFTMAYMEGCVNEEIAQRLGINNQSVRNNKARALRLLRTSLLGKKEYGLFLIWLAVQNNFRLF